MALDEKYDFQQIEQKWQARWREADLYRVAQVVLTAAIESGSNE